MRFVRFAPGHFDEISLQPEQSGFLGLMTPEIGRALANDMSWTGLDNSGRVLAIAGVHPMWPGRAVVWALLSGEIRRRGFLAIHNRVRRELRTAHAAGYPRLETTVDPNFANAVRWAAALGFECEGRMRRYGPDGRDHLLMVHLAPVD